MGTSRVRLGVQRPGGAGLPIVAVPPLDPRALLLSRFLSEFEHEELSSAGTDALPEESAEGRLADLRQAESPRITPDEGEQILQSRIRAGDIVHGPVRSLQD